MEIEKLATILSCIVVAIIILAGLTLIITAIRDERHAARSERDQAEADAHLRTLATRQAEDETFDLISKGKGGAI